MFFDIIILRVLHRPANDRMKQFSTRGERSAITYPFKRYANVCVTLFYPLDIGYTWFQNGKISRVKVTWRQWVIRRENVFSLLIKFEINQFRNIVSCYDRKGFGRSFIPAFKCLLSAQSEDFLCAKYIMYRIK